MMTLFIASFEVQNGKNEQKQSYKKQARTATSNGQIARIKNML